MKTVRNYHFNAGHRSAIVPRRKPLKILDFSMVAELRNMRNTKNTPV